MLKKLYQNIEISISKAWYKGSPFLYPLWPFSKIFEVIVTQRYSRAKNNLRPGKQRVPIVVVGNITVGGSGKTPCVMALAKFLQEHGYSPGIVTRGHGAKMPYTPYPVNGTSIIKETGDEAFLLFRELKCPVVIDPQRLNAVEYLLQAYPHVNIILSDDGLQHYNLPRDYEIAVIDNTRGFGNGWCLPAGPLREPISRLETVDLVLAQGAHFTQEPRAFVSVLQPQNNLPLNFDFSKPIHAVAGIGNPDRFFATLEGLGLNVIPHAFPDHHWFTANDLDYNDTNPLIMTAKDAVKCEAFAKSHWYYLHVMPQFNENTINELKKILKVNL
jgi:tetraacyldisaccharide 4'-kinase